MHSLIELFQKGIHLLREPGDIIAWGGYPALTAIIFLETGAMVFFLPGDSLLFVAGLYAGQGSLNIFLLNALLITAAVAGDATSYWIGRKTGPALFNKPKSRFFNPDHVKAAQEFYDRWGGFAIIAARFAPLVRTFVPVVAGVAGMSYRKFALYNMIGGASWVLSMTVAGYFLGNFAFIRVNLEKVIIGIVAISVLPIVMTYFKERARKKAAARAEADAEAQS